MCLLILFHIFFVTIHYILENIVHGMMALTLMARKYKYVPTEYIQWREFNSLMFYDLAMFWLRDLYPTLLVIDHMNVKHLSAIEFSVFVLSEFWKLCTGWALYSANALIWSDRCLFLFNNLFEFVISHIIIWHLVTSALSSAFSIQCPHQVEWMEPGGSHYSATVIQPTWTRTPSTTT